LDSLVHFFADEHQNQQNKEELGYFLSRQCSHLDVKGRERHEKETRQERYLII
jgi:hypothetical protein